jgi:hypothetical protein
VLRCSWPPAAAADATCCDANRLHRAQLAHRQASANRCPKESLMSQVSNRTCAALQLASCSCCWMPRVVMLTVCTMLSSHSHGKAATRCSPPQASYRHPCLGCHSPCRGGESLHLLNRLGSSGVCLAVDRHAVRAELRGRISFNICNPRSTSFRKGPCEAMLFALGAEQTITPPVLVR